MPNPLAYVRDQMLNSRAEMSFNPSESGNNERVDYLLFHVFDSDTTFNGEAFSAGDILIGDNSSGEENLTYKGGAWLVRVGTTNYVTFGVAGVRITGGGGLALKQLNYTVVAGVNEIDDTGGAAGVLRSSHIYINGSAGAFTIRSLGTPVHAGLFVIIKNGTADNMTIEHGGAASAGYLAISTPTGANMTTVGPGTAILIGNETTSQFDLISLEG
jgi:hypothetical protein